MKFYIIVLLIAASNLSQAKVTNRKEIKTQIPQNAIIAIQIIDPHENDTDTKNSKRTIESSLGYGYQNSILGNPSQPKYEVYKYSQHDIPPYTPSTFTQTSNYQVPSRVAKPVHRTNAAVSSYYQPGTILFSTINQNGQLGELSSQFPGSLEKQQYPIPVIILRVHPDQLANPLYPNLPQNHLHASTINSIDINSLLSNYIKGDVKQHAAPVQNPIASYQQQQEPVPVYQHQQESLNTYQQPQQSVPVYQRQPETIPAYQQQYQHQYQQEYQDSRSYDQPEPVQYQGGPEYQNQQYYSQYPYEGTQEVEQSYHTPQEASPAQQQVADAGENYQYSSYQADAAVYQQPAPVVETYKSTELLTHENYPSEKHTQVIFNKSKSKPSSRSKHTYRSAPRLQSQSAKTQRVSSMQENQLHSERTRTSQTTEKYFQPNQNYYTLQYSEQDGYSHQKVRNFGVKEVIEDPYKDAKPSHKQNYLYLSRQSSYREDE